MDDEWRKEKISFVSNLLGCTHTELILAFSIAPICTLFYQFLSLGVLKSSSNLSRFVVEFLCIVFPTLVVITFTQYTPTILVVLFLVSTLGFLISKCRKQGNYSEKVVSIFTATRKPFLDDYRAFMMLVTCMAILAVDFTVFPRSFAKTETYGVSLMDMGVGSVVFSGALVSRQARAASAPQSKKKDGRANNQQKNSGRLFYAIGAVKSSLPLVIIGLARLVLTKSTNYQEHVAEYGVHWNFFFTLGFVALFISLLDIPAKFCGTSGLLIAVVYQIALSQFGLRDYILNHPRDNLINANKEGLCSIFGYIAIYLIGTQVGNFIFQSRKTVQQIYAFVVKLCLVDVAFWVMAYASELYVDSVSRRMGNLGYVLYTVSYNLFLLAAHTVFLLFAAKYTPATPTSSMIINAINTNQLFVFLLGNLLTGLVNFMFNTIRTPPLNSMMILIGYLLVVCVIAVFLNKRGIIIKL